MKLVNINGEREVFGRNAAVKLIFAMDHCPQCGLLPEEHRDEECDLHYAPETEYRAALADLVKPVHILKQFLNVKGKSDWTRRK